MERDEKIRAFLDCNLDTFLKDIMELAPKERAKAFLTLMNDKSLNVNSEPVKSIAPIQWIKDATDEELREELKRLREREQRKEREREES